jgi:hypothetical protein
MENATQSTGNTAAVAPPTVNGTTLAEEAPRLLVTVGDVYIEIDKQVSCYLPDVPRVEVKRWHAIENPMRVALLLPHIEAQILPPERTDEKLRQATALLEATSPLTFVRGGICPIDGKRTVLDIFEDDTVRVYALFLADKPQDLREAKFSLTMMPGRYTLQHSGPQWAFESMPLATWIEEVAQELQAASGEEPPVAEEVGDAVVQS